MLDNAYHAVQSGGPELRRIDLSAYLVNGFAADLPKPHPTRLQPKLERRRKAEDGTQHGLGLLILQTIARTATRGPWRSRRPTTSFKFACFFSCLPPLLLLFLPRSCHKKRRQRPYDRQYPLVFSLWRRLRSSITTPWPACWTCPAKDLMQPCSVFYP
ncbi:MAG: hypothetical protein ACLUNZ_08680 [Evtepia sp.]